MTPLLFLFVLFPPTPPALAQTEPSLFAGSFSSSYLSQATFHVSHEGEKLFLQKNQGKKVLLTQTKSNRYQLEGYPVEIEFPASPKDPIESFVMIQNRQEILFYRVEKLQADYRAIAQTLRPHGLSDAVLMNDVASAKVLIEKGADVMELDTRSQFAGPNGRRPLNWAALVNNVAMIELLLDAGADINATNLSGYTPLHHAAEGNALEAVKLLIQKGADKRLLNKNKQTAEEVAARLDYRGLLPFLTVN